MYKAPRKPLNKCSAEKREEEEKKTISASKLCADVSHGNTQVKCLMYFVIHSITEELLTVELQDGVVDLALELPGALEGAGHPQPLVHGHGRDDVVPDVRRHLPLRQDSPDDEPGDAD